MRQSFSWTISLAIYKTNVNWYCLETNTVLLMFVIALMLSMNTLWNKHVTRINHTQLTNTSNKTTKTHSSSSEEMIKYFVHRFSFTYNAFKVTSQASFVLTLCFIEVKLQTHCVHNIPCFENTNTALKMGPTENGNAN